MKKYLYDERYVAKQISEVQTIEKDWNCDGDVYYLEGMWIEWENDGQIEFVSLAHINSYFKPL